MATYTHRRCISHQLCLLFVTAFYACQQYSPEDLLLEAKQTSPSTTNDTFTDGIDDWRVTGNGADSIPQHGLVNGNPTGHLSVIDHSGDIWYFVAPKRIVNQLRGSYGREFSFDINDTGDGLVMYGQDVILVSGNRMLFLNFFNRPVNEWFTFKVNLDDSMFWQKDYNQLATKEEIQDVVAKLDGLWIRGDYIAQDDEGMLDNFVIK
jgi:hypothetical protein